MTRAEREQAELGRAEGQRTANRYWLTVCIATALVALIAFSIANVGDDNAQEEKDGMLCILSELKDHRVNSYDADRDEAAADNRSFNVPRPAPERVPAAMEDSCKRFLD